MALDMMVDRSLNRYAHGSILAEKQGIQWMIADSAMELYQSKLMVLHAAYKIDRKEDFSAEVSMAKHFVANASAASSTVRSRCTARSVTPPTPRSRACTSTRAGPVSPTAPTKCT